MELLSPMHLLIIFLVALLLFGPKKLPELGKGIGEGFRALKEGMKEKSAAADEQASKASATQAPGNTEAKS